MALYNRKRARRSLLDTMLFRVVSQIATVTTYVVMVRGMTREDFGVLNVLYSLIPLVSTAASLGIEQVLRRYQPEYLRAGQVHAAHWLVRTASRLRLGTSVLLLGGIALTWHLVAPMFHLERYRLEFWLFCPLIMLHFQTRILQLALTSQLLQRQAIGMVVLQSFVKLIAYSSLLVYGSLTLVGVIVIDAISYIAMYAGLRLAYERHCRPEAPASAFRLEPQERKRLLRYGLLNNFNDAGSMVLSSKSDNFFIAAFIDPVAVASYSFYIRLNEMIVNALPVRLFSSVIQPFFFAVTNDEATEKLPRYFTFLVNINLLIHLPVVAFSLVYHQEIVSLIAGRKYVDSSWLLPMVTGFGTLSVIGEPSTLVAQHAERPTVMLMSKVFAIYNIAAIVILLPVAGLYGAALASGTAALFKNLFIWWHVRKVARWRNLPHVIAMVLLIWGGAAVACLGLKTFVGGPVLLQLFLGGVVMILAELLYLRSPGVAKSDRDLMATVFRGREKAWLTRLGLIRRRTERA